MIKMPTRIKYLEAISQKIFRTLEKTEILLKDTEEDLNEVVLHAQRFLYSVL